MRKKKCIEQNKKAIEGDIKVMMHFDSPTMAKIIGYSSTDFHDENNIIIVMEFLKHGSLSDVLKQIRDNNIPANYTTQLVKSF